MANYTSESANRCKRVGGELRVIPERLRSDIGPTTGRTTPVEGPCTEEQRSEDASTPPSESTWAEARVRPPLASVAPPSSPPLSPVAGAIRVSPDVHKMASTSPVTARARGSAHRARRALAQACAGARTTSTSSISKMRSLPARGWLASRVTPSSSISATVTIRDCPLACTISSC